MDNFKPSLAHSLEFTKSEEPIRFIRRDPQIPYPLHTHDFSELVIILGGQGTHITKHSRFELFAGDIFVINGETAHGYENPKNLHLVNIMYRPELLTDFLKTPYRDMFLFQN